MRLDVEYQLMKRTFNVAGTHHISDMKEEVVQSNLDLVKANQALAALRSKDFRENSSISIQKCDRGFVTNYYLKEQLWFFKKHI